MFIDIKNRGLNVHASFTTTNILTRKKSYGRRHLSFQPLSLPRKALSRLPSGCRKLGRPLDKNTVRWHSAVQRLASGWAKTHAPGMRGVYYLWSGTTLYCGQI